MEERIVFQSTVLGQLDICKQKNEVEPSFHIYAKTNSKLIINLNIRTSAIKLFEESIKILWPQIKQSLLRYDTKSMSNKIKRYIILNFIKMKKFCAKLSRKLKLPTEWEKIFAIIYLMRDLYSEYKKNS